MADQADTRRMRLMDLLAASEEPQELEYLAVTLRCDVRTIRRDLDQLQRVLDRVHGLEVRRGKVLVARAGYSPGYFTDQLGRNATAKEAIARAVVASLGDDLAVALTAGSTPYAVAREIRRVTVEGGPPHNLIVFTNSVPSLLELVAAGVSTGVLGEIYAPEDCAFHTPEFHSAFQPSMAIVGASGVLFGAQTTLHGLDLFSHRAEEAAFLKQLLAGVPEIIIAADSTKLGRRHPWSFGGSILAGKSVLLVTDVLTDQQREELTQLTERLALQGTRFQFAVACDTDSGDRVPAPADTEDAE
ncbi:MAG: transcriptional regulator, DeoR family [Chthonomonadales bacterium]|nr:transcriptional regulator, DeoR family [Chthonomonadales bacterium]